MSTRFRGRSLRARVFLLTMAGMFSLLLILGVSDYYSLKQSTNKIFQERLLLAGTIQSGVETALRQNLMMLQNVSSTANGAEGAIDSVALRRSLHSARLLSVFSSVSLLDAHGELIMREPHEATAGELNMKSLLQPVLSGKLYVSNILEDQGTSRKIILCLVPIAAHGDPFRLVAGEIDLDQNPLSKSFANLDLGDSTDLEIVDANGYIVASNRGENVENRSTFTSGRKTEMQYGRSSIFLAGNSQEKVVADVPFQAIPWRLYLIQHESEILAPAQGMAIRFLVFSALLILIAIPLALGVSDSVISPVNELTKAARKISEGDFDQSIPADGGEEIGRLGQTLDQMRRKLKSLLQQIESANHILESRVEQRTAEVRQLYEELKQKEEIRRVLLHKIISAQEVERKRISRELHDELSQVIAALMLYFTNTEENPQQLNVPHLKDLAERAMDSVQRLILDLRPPVLDDLGLFSAIRSYAEERLTQAGIEVVCTGNVSDLRLDPEIEIELFRIAQESITNIARHAKAESVMITLEQRKGSLALEVEDDGSGFDPAQIGAPDVTNIRGMGLLSMKERVQLLDGSFSLRSTPDSGTFLSVVVPLRNLEAKVHE